MQKNELPYVNLTLSDLNVVKLLITNMDRFNKYYNSETNNDIYVAGNTKELNQELIALYADLYETMKSCSFSKKQKLVISLMQQGFNLSDIGRLNSIKIHRKGARHSLDIICRKIVEENYNRWVSVYKKGNSG